MQALMHSHRSGSRHKLRLATGSAFIELGLLSVVLVIVALLCLDIGMVAWGTSRNDEASHDACRAAADGTSSSDSLNRAQAALISHAADGFWLTSPQVDTSQFVYQDYGGNPPSGEGPYVTVATTSTVRIPVPISFLGAKFGSSTFTASKSFSFPLVKAAVSGDGSGSSTNPGPSSGSGGSSSGSSSTSSSSSPSPSNSASTTSSAASSGG